MLASALAWPARALLSERGFAVGLALYLIGLFALRAYTFPGASEDDGEQLLFAQTWAWGYKSNQPPLYTWLVLAVEPVFGAGAAAVVAVKFAGLAAIYAFLYRLGRRVLAEARMAALAGLSAVGLYYVAWDAVMNYSHTVWLGALVLAAAHAVLRLEDRNGLGDYLWLGVVFGLGINAKYNFVLFAFPFVFAAALDPVLRPRLATRRAALALAVAAAMAAPHLVWSLTDPGGLAGTTEHVLTGEGLAAFGQGLGSAALNAVSILMPLAALVALVFPRVLLPVRGADDPESRRRRRLFERYFLGVAVLVAAGVAATGAVQVRTHWLFVLIPFPVYAAMRIEAAGAGEGRMRAFVALLAALAVAVPIGIGVRHASGPDVCRKCNFFMPYDALADGLRAAGFARGTIVAHDRPNRISGNLGVRFPDARALSTRHPHFVPPPGDRPGACLLIWNPEAGGGPDFTRRLAAERLGARLPEAPETGHVEAPIAGAGGRSVRLEFLLIQAGTGDCR